MEGRGRGSDGWSSFMTHASSWLVMLHHAYDPPPCPLGREACGNNNWNTARKFLLILGATPSRSLKNDKLHTVVASFVVLYERAAVLHRRRPSMGCPKCPPWNLQKHIIFLQFENQIFKNIIVFINIINSNFTITHKFLIIVAITFLKTNTFLIIWKFFTISSIKSSKTEQF